MNVAIVILILVLLLQSLQCRAAFGSNWSQHLSRITCMCPGRKRSAVRIRTRASKQLNRSGPLSSMVCMCSCSKFSASMTGQGLASTSTDVHVSLEGSQLTHDRTGTSEQYN